MSNRTREITKGWIPMAVIVLAVCGAVNIITLAIALVVRFARSL